MSKHKQKKHNKPLQDDDREMYRCDICKKRFPYEGYIPSPTSTPFMFIVLGDREKRRFTLSVASMENMAKYNEEEALWFVCSDRQCIYKSFLMWREWDKQKAITTFALKQVGFLSEDGEMTPMGKDLQRVLQDTLVVHPRPEESIEATGDKPE